MHSNHTASITGTVSSPGTVAQAGTSDNRSSVNQGTVDQRGTVQAPGGVTMPPVRQPGIASTMTPEEEARRAEATNRRRDDETLAADAKAAADKAVADKEAAAARAAANPAARVSGHPGDAPAPQPLTPAEVVAALDPGLVTNLATLRADLENWIASGRALMDRARDYINDARRK